MTYFEKQKKNGKEPEESMLAILDEPYNVEESRDAQEPCEL